MDVIVDLTGGTVELYEEGRLVAAFDPGGAVDLINELVTGVEALGRLSNRRRRWSRLARTVRRLT